MLQALNNRFSGVAFNASNRSHSLQVQMIYKITNDDIFHQVSTFYNWVRASNDVRKCSFQVRCNVLLWNFLVSSWSAYKFLYFRHFIGKSNSTLHQSFSLNAGACSSEVTSSSKWTQMNLPLWLICICILLQYFHV